VTTNVAVLSRPSILATARGYIALMKPRVISLLLVTTVPAMVAAQGGWPSTWLVLATLAGGTLSAGGANAINCWYDRDIDRLMKRTRRRPVASGAIEPAYALSFGIALAVASTALLWLAASPAAAVLSLAALLFYVFVYTIWLKRRTPQNIVIGGAAGAFPPMVGWAAVTGGLAIEPLIMFAIIFMWTPPHFWALALRLKDDYAAAGVPMLSVTAGPAATRRQILVYAVLLVAVTFTLAPAGGMWFVYLPAAVGLGGWFIYEAARLWARPQTTSPMRVYKCSLLYLALLFLAIGIDGGLLS
jgi:protoheme IX farnesyltransferase